MIMFAYLKIKTRLHENEDNTHGLGGYADHKGDAAFLDCRVIIKIGLHHLDQTEAAVDHGGHGEYGRAHAHIQLARAILVVVGEIES
jgi:hypothetical protein